MWQPIETAPKDGTVIVIKTKPYSFNTSDDINDIVNVPSFEYECFWNPKFDSWVDENGGYEGKVVELKATGGWSPVDNNGWIQPNEAESWKHVN